MEVLSYGNRVKVLSPESIVNEIKIELTQTLGYYQIRMLLNLFIGNSLLYLNFAYVYISTI